MKLEDIFGTMLHELSHIAHGKHTPAFHRLVDELHKEWEMLEATDKVVDDAN